MKKFVNKKCFLYWLHYTMLFLVVAAGVFIWFLHYSKSLCWTLDTSSQYIPKAVYFVQQFREWLSNALQGDFTFRMYDFKLGLGDSVPLHMEPVYWLYLLFDEKNIEFAYGFLILLRFYLAGLSISAFLFYFKYEQWQCLIGSMVYVFSGYGLYAGMRHSHFIIPMITLPVLLLGMEEIYRKKRWYVCTITVALSLWCGYYFTYMNTLIMGVYFLIRYFGSSEKKSISDFALRMRTIICSYLLGVGIANITFFNTFADYLTSARSSSDVKVKINLWNYGSDWGLNFFEAFLSAKLSPGTWMLLGFIPLSYICITLLFIRRKNLQLKIAFVTGTVFGMIPVFGYIFCGFGSLNNRWCYAYAFVVAVITAKMVGQLHTINRKELILTGIFILPYEFVGVGAYLLHRSYDKTVVISGLLLAATYILLVVIHCFRSLPGKFTRTFITLNVVGLLWVSGAFRFCVMINEFTSSGNVWDKATGTELRVMDEVEDESFYRSYTKNSMSDVQGASMMLGYNGVVYYSSTISKPMIDFYRETGLSSWSLVRLRGFDGRGFLNSLASVKYEVISEEDSYDVPYGYTKIDQILRDGIYYDVYENKNVLPIGYSYDKVMSIDEFEKLDYADRQEVMLQTAIVEPDGQDINYQEVSSEDVTKTEASSKMNTAEAKINVTGQKVPVTKVETNGDISFDGKTISVNEKNASLTLWFDGLDNCETYVNFENLTMNNGKKIWFYLNSDSEDYSVKYCCHGNRNTYYTGQEDYIFNLGYSEKGKTFCTIRFNNKCTINVDDLSVYCQPMEPLDTYVTERKLHALENVVVGTNEVSGTISLPSDELLVLSIPYQNGWSAYVDGKKSELRRVNCMYMGLDLEAGEHTIELKFEMPGIKISLVITVVSLILFITALVIRRKRKNAA